MTKTHGMSGTRFYRIWAKIIQRCYNERCENFRFYGNKGIEMSKDWFDNFENFKEDMYESYIDHVEEFGEIDTTIDRINSEGDYCKENCQWATRYEQTQNTRNHKQMEVTRKDISRINPKISVYVYRNRKEAGYTEEEIAKTKPHITNNEVSQKQLIKDNEVAFQDIRERWREVMAYRFGVNDGELKTLAKTGERFGLSRERARQIVNSGMHEFLMKIG